MLKDIRTSLLSELERAVGEDYSTLTRLWFTIWSIRDGRGPKTWLLRDQIRRDQEHAEQEFGRFSVQSMDALSCYAGSFPIGSDQNIRLLESLYLEVSPHTDNYVCQSLARQISAYFVKFHMGKTQADAPVYNMRLALVSRWQTECQTSAVKLEMLKAQDVTASSQYIKGQPQ